MATDNNAPEFVYQTIPMEWVCIYQRILIMFSNYGVDSLRDCCLSCKNPNNTAIQLLNQFNAAVAARRLSIGNNPVDINSYQAKLADTLIKSIEYKLDHIGNVTVDSTNPIIFPIDENGHIKVMISCRNNFPDFTVDIESGDLHMIADPDDYTGFYLDDDEKDLMFNEINP